MNLSTTVPVNLEYSFNVMEVVIYIRPVIESRRRAVRETIPVFVRTLSRSETSNLNLNSRGMTSMSFSEFLL